MGTVPGDEYTVLRGGETTATRGSDRTLRPQAFPTIFTTRVEEGAAYYYDMHH